MTYISENDCDLIALTHNGEIIGYTKLDAEVDAWIQADKNNDWFCVNFEGEEK